MLRIGALAATAALFAAGQSSAALAAECPNAGAVSVPGAERQEQACLDDLTTAGTSQTGHTDQSDWAGLAAPSQRTPSGVPGLQVDGYFPDTSTANATHGWNHDSQFVIRFPNQWNGKLVVVGAPGVRKQYAHDQIIGDWLLDRGYAYAATDKGNGGTNFFKDGVQPGDAGVEWNFRVTQIAIAAKEAVRQRYGRTAARTYVTGISQGGYLTRWQLENRPELYDGGVDWEGSYWTADSPNIFTNLAAALKNYPRYRATGDKAAHDAMIAGGFAPGSEFLWEDHYGVYWDLTQRTYREEFDPDYDGATEAGTPFCQSGTPNCDADYDYSKRGQGVRTALGRIANTGRIGKPMLTLHGTLDSLLPIKTNGDPYSRLVQASGSGVRHRYYVIEDGNHVDGRYAVFPDRLRPIFGCWAEAFIAMEAWVEKGTSPPSSQFVPNPREGDITNRCRLEPGPDVASPFAGTGRDTPAAGSSFAGTSSSARRRPRGLSVRVVRRGRRFTTTGRLSPPSGVANGEACGSGVVSVQVKSGRRTVSTRRTRLRADCTFASAVAFRASRRLGRGPLAFTVRFFGNRIVTGLTAGPRRVRLR
jgi:predicted esterase